MDVSLNDLKLNNEPLLVSPMLSAPLLTTNSNDDVVTDIVYREDFPIYDFNYDWGEFNTSFDSLCQWYDDGYVTCVTIGRAPQLKYKYIEPSYSGAPLVPYAFYDGSDWIYWADLPSVNDELDVEDVDWQSFFLDSKMIMLGTEQSSNQILIQMTNQLNLMNNLICAFLLVYCFELIRRTLKRIFKKGDVTNG